MDLAGIPLRIVVGEKNLPNVEIKPRKESQASLVPADIACQTVRDIIKREMELYS